MRTNIILGLYILVILGLLAYCEYDVRNTDKLRGDGTVAFQDIEAADESNEVKDETEMLDITEMIDAKEQAEPEEYDTVLTVVDASGNSRKVSVHIIVGDMNGIEDITLENTESDSLESEEALESAEIAWLFIMILVFVCVPAVCVATDNDLFI